VSSQEALFEKYCQKARENRKLTGSALDKSLFGREFLCLTLLEALAALTLLTDSSLVLLPRSLSSALLRSLPKIFSHFHFP